MVCHDVDMPSMSGCATDFRTAIMRLRQARATGQLQHVSAEKLGSTRAMLETLRSASARGGWVHPAMADDFERAKQLLVQQEGSQADHSSGSGYSDLPTAAKRGSYSGASGTSASYGGGYGSPEGSGYGGYGRAGEEEGEEGGYGEAGGRSSHASYHVAHGRRGHRGSGTGGGDGQAGSGGDALMVFQNALALLVFHYCEFLTLQLAACQTELQKKVEDTQATEGQLSDQVAALLAEKGKLQAKVAALEGQVKNLQQVCQLHKDAISEIMGGALTARTAGGHTYREGCHTSEPTPRSPRGGDHAATSQEQQQQMTVQAAQSQAAGAVAVPAPGTSLLVSPRAVQLLQELQDTGFFGNSSSYSHSQDPSKQVGASNGAGGSSSGSSGSNHVRSTGASGCEASTSGGDAVQGPTGPGNHTQPVSPSPVPRLTALTPGSVSVPRLPLASLPNGAGRTLAFGSVGSVGLCYGSSSGSAVGGAAEKLAATAATAATAGSVDAATQSTHRPAEVVETVEVGTCTVSVAASCADAATFTAAGEVRSEHASTGTVPAASVDAGTCTALDTSAAAPPLPLLQQVASAAAAGQADPPAHAPQQQTQPQAQQQQQRAGRHEGVAGTEPWSFPAVYAARKLAAMSAVGGGPSSATGGSSTGASAATAATATPPAATAATAAGVAALLQGVVELDKGVAQVYQGSQRLVRAWWALVLGTLGVVGGVLLPRSHTPAL